MSDRWISGEEVMVATGWTARTMQRKVRDGSLQSRRRPTERGGRPAREYSVESLPYEARFKLEQQRASAEKSALILAGDEPAALESPSDVLLPKVALCSPEEEEQARERYRIIEPLINFEAEQRSVAHSQLHLDLGLKLPDGAPVTNRSQLCLYLAGKHQISEATLWRWVSRFKDQGLSGLADRMRKDKGKSRFFEHHPKAATLAAYLFLEQRQSIRAAFEAIQRDCISLGLKPRELPSYSTVYDFLNSKAFSEPLKLLAREGRRVYRERCAPYVSRDYSATAANEIWVSDHMIHDVEVQNDCFLDAEWGAPVRLRFTCILDFRSRFVVGTSWAWEGSSRSITTALRHAVRAHGCAEVFYCDNGKDYLKVAKKAMPAYLRDSGITPENWYERDLAELQEAGVLARLGMAVQHCIVRHPQSKHVERFFRTMHERFDKKFPTYTGGSPAARPDFATEAMAEHRKLLRMGLPGGMSLHPPASVFIRMALAWIEEYHSTPMGEKVKGMEGLSPRQGFEMFRNPRQKPAPAPEVLALMLAERKCEVAVRECSVVLAKKRYVGDDEISAAMLYEMNDRKVTLAYDPLDMEKVAILDLEGRLIAWARQENYVTQSADANDAIAASMKQRRHLEKLTSQVITGIAAAARANGALTDVEHLAARAGVTEVVRQRRERPRGPLDTAPTPLSPDDAARVLLAPDVSEMVTQRRGRLRPDNAAVAPPTAGEIARWLVADLSDEELSTFRGSLKEKA